MALTRLPERSALADDRRRLPERTGGWTGAARGARADDRDADLALKMRTRGRAVMEERLLDLLLQDLRH